jgi:hypothetical protein
MDNGSSAVVCSEIRTSLPVERVRVLLRLLSGFDEGADDERGCNGWPCTDC